MAENSLTNSLQKAESYKAESYNDLLKFPDKFSIKVMGAASTDFDTIVIEIVRQHCFDLKADAITRRTSSSGKYLSLTIPFTAQSRTQLDALYRELSHHEQVLMVL